jgi:four helix bundle protein
MAQPHFEKLVIWQRSMQLVELVYQLTRDFPADEKSGLAATLRRTVTGIPAKIADADGLDDPDKVGQSLNSVRGMIREMQTYTTLCYRLGFLKYLRYKSLRRQLTKLDQALHAQAELLAAPPRAPLLKPRLAA